MDTKIESRVQVVGCCNILFPVPWSKEGIQLLVVVPPTRNIIVTSRFQRVHWNKDITCFLLGVTNTKFSGLASRNIIDSTLNWEPRVITE